MKLKEEMDLKEKLKTMGELTQRRTKVMKSMSEFYDRLPTIENICPDCGSAIKLPKACLAMVEFKAHNDELIDYIIELERIIGELLTK